MRSRLPFRRTACEHDDVLVVHGAGLMRIICEDCGHISFKFDEIEVVAEVHELVSVGSATD